MMSSSPAQMYRACATGTGVNGQEQYRTPPPALRLSVIVPVYNERGTLPEILRRVRAAPLATEIILVDDGSTDGTRELLESLRCDPDVRVIHHPHNLGKGAALRTAFRHATGDIVLVQDADLEYDPTDYDRLIEPIVRDEADVVYGTRFPRGRRPMAKWHAVANRVLTTFSNFLTGLKLTDMETCYKVFRREIIDRLAPRLRENRFGIEPELTAKAARGGYRIREVAIRYHGRTRAQGKKIGWRDGLNALWCIVRYSKWD
jgi:glycosyltransferase involved in cell wall biosynthesis